MYTRSEFIGLIAPIVLEIESFSEVKILPSLTIAQAILESNNGNSGLTKKANNLFGMKGSYKGEYVTMSTKEFEDGRYITINAKFRKYPDWAASVRDHRELFFRLKRYENLRGEMDYKKACENVRRDGYATSPTYTQSLIGLIERYKLYEYDELVMNEGEQMELDVVPSLKGYKGFSIVDGLRKYGYESNFSYRKELAKKLGIEGYKGTSKQNLQMLEILKSR